MNVNRAIFILAVAVAAAGAGVIWQKESIPAPQAAVETAISQEKYDVVYSRDGTKAYIHGVWGYGYNGGGTVGTVGTGAGLWYKTATGEA